MNIKEYEFSDVDFEKISIDDDRICMTNWRGYHFSVNKDDVIALAEHFNITKQIESALLNSLIADFVKGSVPFEDVVASRLNSLELEK